MAATEDEAEMLRSVALQNARSILHARQHAEEELRRQTEWLRITLSSIGDAVISTDAAGNVTFMNGVAETLTGWRQAEALGRPLNDVFHIVNELTREPVENPALRALREGKVVGLANHTVLIARDGTEHPIDDSAAPIHDGTGAPVGAVFVFRDVTEKKGAEELHSRLAAIVESSQDAIVSKSLDGTILSWNAGAEQLFGYKPHEAVGQHITLLIPKDRQQEEYEILSRVIKGERVEHFETVRVSKHGKMIDVSLSISPVRDGAGRIVGASKIARDITYRKQLEESQREADRRKDHFIALLAHELRNPLAPLRNGLQVIKLASNNIDVITEARDMMDRQLGHMVRLIDDLLDISRISQNKMELRRSPVSLAEVLGSAVETARPVIDEAGHEFEYIPSTESIYLDADLTRLAQVFSNLLTNSAKYTERGGRITLMSESQGNEVVVTVRDNGIGIPADSLPRIFDMFSQVDRSIERSTGGLGIGLALVKSLVELHQGTVEVASGGHRQGSAFMVRLPITVGDTTAPHVLSPAKEKTPVQSKRRILVVDDNLDSATSMAMMLKYMGNEVSTAHDGLQAIESAEKFLPDVILMDVGMPRLNGYEATRRIHDQPWGKGIIIIALTGWGQEADKLKSHEAGCNGHLVKPVNLTDLDALLARLMPPHASTDS